MNKVGNGQGAVRKLSGKRSKQYQALVTVGKKIVNDKIVPDQLSLGTYETKQEARLACAKWISNPGNVLDRNITFGAVCERLEIDRHLRTSYNKLKAIHDMPMRKFKMAEVEMASALFEGMSIRSQTDFRMLLNRAFRYCIQHDIIEKDYSQFITFKETAKRKDRFAYSLEEINHALEEPYQRILLYTGLRISELIKMKTEDVKTVNGVLCLSVVEENAKTKASIRLIPVHDKIAQNVKESLGGLWLMEPHLTYNGYRKRYDKFMEQYNMNHTPHDTRRTFATYARKCGMDDFYRKAILGHKQGNITDDIYTDSFIEIAKKEIDKLEFQ